MHFCACLHENKERFLQSSKGLRISFVQWNNKYRIHTMPSLSIAALVAQPPIIVIIVRLGRLGAFVGTLARRMVLLAALGCSCAVVLFMLLTGGGRGFNTIVCTHGGGAAGGGGGGMLAWGGVWRNRGGRWPRGVKGPSSWIA